jgi:hypothetical protein
MGEGLLPVDADGDGIRSMAVDDRGQLARLAESLGVSGAEAFSLGCDERGGFVIHGEISYRIRIVGTAKWPRRRDVWI